MDEETMKYIEDGKLLMNDSKLDSKEALMTLKEFVEEETAKCVWCGDEFPIDELHREKDMGYLCDNCKRGIESRGEELEFEDEYDESLHEDYCKYEVVAVGGNNKVNHFQTDDFEEVKKYFGNIVNIVRRASKNITDSESQLLPSITVVDHSNNSVKNYTYDFQSKKYVGKDGSYKEFMQMRVKQL